MIRVMDGNKKYHMIGVPYIVLIEPTLVMPWYLMAEKGSLGNTDSVEGVKITLSNGKSLDIMEEADEVHIKIALDECKPRGGKK